MIFSKKYDNGLRIIVNEMPSMLSVSMGVLVGVGSSLEDDENNGISHFIEHVNFKGTNRFSPFELSDEFDSIGSQVNAFTSKDITCYYVKSTVNSAERSFELLSDLFLNSTYEESELKKEKDVIIEEINMSEDTPDEVCLDKLALAQFGQSGFGRTILGSKQNVRIFHKPDIEKYKKRFYNADNIVVSFAGKITAAKAEKLVEKYFAPFVSSEKSDDVICKFTENLNGTIISHKDIEQTHFALGFNGLSYDDKDSDILSLVNIILGMGMSSRLFQRVREELGLCYTVYSYPSGYRNTGTLTVYAGVSNETLNPAYEAVLEVLNGAKSGFTEKEFERGKAQVISSFAYGEESTSSQMILYGKYLLFTDKIFDTKKKIENINKIKKSEIDDFINTFDFDNFSLAVVGNKAKKPKLR